MKPGRMTTDPRKSKEQQEEDKMIMTASSSEDEGGGESESKESQDEEVKKISQEVAQDSSWTVSIRDMIFPTLNTDEDADPITMLNFVEDMSAYEDFPQSKKYYILQVALKGTLERKWFQTK